MSLQVWLPLNGNLNNQGLNGINFTNNGATINTSGKIGQCYSFNGSNNYLSATYNFYNTSFSVSTWIYTTSTSATQTICCDRNSVGSGFSIFLIGGKLRIDAGGNNLQWTTNYTYPANTWFHLTVTHDGTNVKYYINGIFQESKAQALNSTYWGTITSIGASQANGSTYSNYLNGRLNDIRIYDHCLSDKEIKEIAKGLVLHYKLDDGYSEITTNLCNGLKNGGRTTLNNNVITTTGENADTYWYVKTSTPLISETTYTLSLECSGLSSNEAFWRFGVGAQNGENCCGNFTIKNGYNTFTFVLPTGLNGVTQFILDDTNRPNWEDVTSFYNVQLEQKDHATGYAGIGGVRNIGYVYDSSGYQNNGTIVGTLSVNNNTSHYSKSILFNGTDACIRVPYKECNPDGIFTLNLWFYKDALGSKNYETLFGGPSGFEMDTRSGASTTLSLYMASTRGGNAFSPFSLSTWYMVTMVRDGTNEMYYINGELKKTIEAKSMPNGIYRIGAWASDTGQNYYGNISDFRIYATVLSDEDILDLYHTPMSIDNKGNIYTRELVEI